MPKRWSSGARWLGLACVLVACGHEPGWLDVVRVQPAAPAEGGVAPLFLNQEITVYFSEPLDRAYLSVDELLRGGTLTLEMGDAPSRWATASRPPSFTP